MQPFEIIAGPLTLWLAPLGTVYPLINVAPAAAWIRVGTNGDANYDEDGIEVKHVQKIETARPAGRNGPVKAWRTEEDLMISLKLWDLTLEQYGRALDSATVTTTAAAVAIAGTKRIGLYQGSEVATFALLARGVSAYADNMAAQYEVPRAFQSASAKPVFKKGKPAGVDLEFTALEDLAALTPETRFGRLIHQHQLPL